MCPAEYTRRGRAIKSVQTLRVVSGRGGIEYHGSFRSATCRPEGKQTHAMGQSPTAAEPADPSAIALPPPRRALRPTVTGGSVRRVLFVLALPVLGEQLLNTFVGLFDVWLAGRISAVATSAVGLAAYVSWLATMIVMLVATGTTALVSRHEGAGQHEEANRDTNQSITLAAVLGVAVFVLLTAIAPWITRYSNMRGEAYTIAVQYLRIDAVGHLFTSLTVVIGAALRGVGDMRRPMFAYAIINTVNVIASSAYVYWFDMGVTGIVGGTVTARFVGALVLVAVLLRGRGGLRLVGREMRVDWSRARRILRIGVPAAVDGAIMWCGHFAFLAVISRVAEGALGQACFAAHIIAVRVEALTYLPALAWATAAATMIGQSLGNVDPDRAKRTGHEAVLQCGLIALVVGIAFYFSAGWIYAQMSNDKLVRSVGPGPFRILALLQPCMAVSIVYIGGMRGAGDTRSPMYITIAGIVIRLSLGYYFGIVLQWGLMGAWMGMFGDMIWRAIASAARFLHGGWLMTRV